MWNGIAEVQVKRQRGKLIVVYRGKTPRGQSVIKGVLPLKGAELSAKNLKKELPAVFAQQVLDV